MDRNHLNPANYRSVGSFIVTSGKDCPIPARIELSDTMLIRWQVNQMVRGYDLSQIDDGLLVSEVEIKGFGIVRSQGFTIPASDRRVKRVEIVELDLSLPQTLSFRPPAVGVSNSTLEMYAYIGDDLDLFDERMPTNNPAVFDPSLIAQGMAITNQANTANNTKDTSYTVKAWSGNMANHVALAANPARLGVKIYNSGNNRIYLDIGSPDGKQFGNYDDVIEKGGTYYSTNTDRALPLNLYLDQNKPDQQIFITELLP